MVQTSLRGAELASEPESTNRSNGFRLAPVTGRNEGLWTATRCSWLKQGGTTELLKPPSLGPRDGGVCVFAV